MKSLCQTYILQSDLTNLIPGNNNFQQVCGIDLNLKADIIIVFLMKCLSDEDKQERIMQDIGNIVFAVFTFSSVHLLKVLKILY